MPTPPLPPSGEPDSDTAALIQRAVEAANNSIVIADVRAPDAPLIYVNEGFLRITGYDRDEVVGRNCRFLQGDDRDQPPRVALRRALHDGTTVGGVLLRNYRKDGSLFWNELYMTPVVGADGRPTHFIGVQNDVTDRVEAIEETQRRIAQELHDGIGQSLVGASLLSEVLVRDLRAAGLPEAGQAERIARLLSESVEQLKALSLGLTPLDLNPSGLMTGLTRLAHDVESLFHVPCHFRLPEPVLVPNTDAAHQLFRVAQEAASNAVRHGRPSAIEIALAHTADGGVCLTVEDDGRGISREALARAKGVGLRSMRDRALAVAGALTVEPRAGGGTRVALTVAPDVLGPTAD